MAFSGRTLAFVVHELRTQRRSLRFRVAAVTYVAAGSLPALLTYMRRTGDQFFLGGATYARETAYVLPLLTGVLAVLLSLDGIGRERGSGAWSTLGLTDLSNAGYLLRRWLALQAVIVPLTALPFLAAAGFAIAGGATGSVAEAFWGPWLVHILPLAVLGTTLGLGLGTLGGGGMGTFVTGLLFLVGLPSLVNAALEPLGYTFRPPLDWLDHRLAVSSIGRISQAFSARNDQTWMFPAPASEAGFDLGTAAEQSRTGGLLVAAVAAAALGLAVARLQRTRPDLRPWTVRPDHPLRSFQRSFARLREAFVPDPALPPADRIAVAVLLLGALAAGAAVVARADRYDELAWRRLRAEQSPPEPTAREVVPGLWSVEGRVGADGAVALQVTGTMRNTGRTPQAHLAFALDPELVLEAATAGAGRVRPARSWDRLTVELDPPLAAGESRELRFRLSGRPASIVFPGLPKPDMLVDAALGAHQRKRPGRDLVDLTASYRIPAVSGLRVALEAEDLLPVPRYGPWTREDDNGSITIAGETYFPRAEIRLALTVPPDLFLAGACGGIARGGRLEDRCVLPLPEAMVAGGRQRPLGTGEAGGAMVAVFPSHRAAGTLHLGFLERGSRMMGEAWPGLGGLADMVILEWPARSAHSRGSAFWFFEDYDPFSGQTAVELHGRLVFLAEARLIQTRPVSPELLVATVVSSRLAARRRLDPGRQAFFLSFFRALALQRLGLGAERGAVVGPIDLRYLSFVQQAALDGTGDYSYQFLRFPALVAALEHRAGREPLRAAIDELLSRPGDRPATFEDFEEILRRHAREPVDAMIRDFFRAGRLPELVLEDVAFRRAGGGWRATGRVHNLADGEATCRVVLAATAPVETLVTVGTGGSASFDLATPHTPQAVYLDPDLECHRMVRKGAPRDRAFFTGARP